MVHVSKVLQTIKLALVVIVLVIICVLFVHVTNLPNIQRQIVPRQIDTRALTPEQKATLFFLCTFSAVENSNILQSVYLPESSVNYLPVNSFKYKDFLLLPPIVSNVVTPNIDTYYFQTVMNLENGRVFLDVPPAITNPDGRPKYFSIQVIDLNALNITTISSRLGNQQSYIFTYDPNVNNENDNIPLSSNVSSSGSNISENTIMSNSKYLLLLGRVQVNYKDPSDVEKSIQYMKQFKIRTDTTASNATPQTGTSLPRGIVSTKSATDTGRYITQYESIRPLVNNNYSTEEIKSLSPQQLDIGFKTAQDIIRYTVENTNSTNLTINDLMINFKNNDRAVFAINTLSKLYDTYGESTIRSLIAYDVIAWQFIYKQDELEAEYYFINTDSQNQLLVNANNYFMSFPTVPNVGAFWSVTLYNKDGFMVENSDKIYSVTSLDVPKNVTDFRIYIGQQNPNLQNVYFLRSPPIEIPTVFYLILRCYVPLSVYVPQNPVKVV